MKTVLTKALAILLVLCLALGLFPGFSLATEAEAAPAAAAETWLWPIDGCFRVQSNYGYRDIVGDGHIDYSYTHEAIDISPSISESPLTPKTSVPIRAAKSGKILYSYRGNKYNGKQGEIPYRKANGGTVGKGNYIIIDHGDGTYSQYYHMIAEGMLPDNTPVTRGQTIGYVGATGQAYGPHLHFMISKITDNPNPSKNTVINSFSNPKYMVNPMPANPSSEISIAHWGKNEFGEEQYALPKSWPTAKTYYALVPCNHQYNDNKHPNTCSLCSEEFNYNATLDTSAEGRYKLSGALEIGYVRETPYEVGVLVKKLNSLNTLFSKVDVVGSVTNSYGRKWYKTKDGYYIYHEHLTYDSPFPEGAKTTATISATAT